MWRFSQVAAKCGVAPIVCVQTFSGEFGANTAGALIQSI
jgi:hypothetical protein